MSPRAAWRLEALGFRDVYDYEGGKMDWLAFGLPSAGSAASEPTLGDLVRRDAPRCLPSEGLSELSGRMSEGWTLCAVVNEAGILLGRLRRRHLDEKPEARAEDVMENGPSTYRPSTPAAEVLERMKARGFDMTFVTDSDGRLWGLVSREDLEGALGEARP
jgi:CBS-domain-containing membrane protein